MNVKRRLFGKPLSTIIWILLVMIMTGFLTVGCLLMFSTKKLADSLDKSHIAIAVRTDPAYPATGYEAENREKTHAFTLEDKAYFESLSSVKAVHNNTLSGASSPVFEPITGLNKWLHWSSNVSIYPYSNFIISGTVNAVERDEYYDYFVIGVFIDDIHYIHPQLHQAEELLRYLGGIVLIVDDPDDDTVANDLILPGERYVFSGLFNPAWMGERYWHLVDSPSIFAYCAQLCSLSADGDMLIANILPDSGESSEGGLPDYSFPAAQKLGENESAAEFLEKDGIWKDYISIMDKQYHSMPVIGTEKLEAFYGFVKGNLAISEGRIFTEEEYQSGAKVLVISEETARGGNIKVGDRIPLNQYLCVNTEYGTNVSVSDLSLNNPEIDLLSMNTSYGPDEEFTIVGIYRMTELWSSGAYSITPNTVFMPKKAQIDGAFGEIGEVDELFGIYLGLELQNGRVDEFNTQLASSKFANQFYPFDQGYETVQKSVNSLADSTGRIVLVSVIGWVLFLLLLLAMYQASQKQTMGVMRSLGNLPHQTASYLFFSGLAVVAVGILLGTVISWFIMDSMQKKILADAIAGIDSSVFSGQPVITPEKMGEMVNSSMPGTKTIVLFALFQLGLIAIPMLIQAVSISRKNPRDLIRG